MGEGVGPLQQRTWLYVRGPVRTGGCKHASEGIFAGHAQERLI